MDKWAEVKNREYCAKLFEQVYIKKELKIEPTEAMLWGNYFEARCEGKIDDKDLSIITEKMQKSVYHKRIEEQVSLFHRAIKYYGVKIIKWQSYEQAIIVEKINPELAIEIILSGKLDINAEMADKPVVFDTKMTTDIFNEYAKKDKENPYTWGALYKMALTQSKHYPLMRMLNGKDCPAFYYWIADRSTECGFRIINVQHTPAIIANYKANIVKTFNEIVEMQRTGFIPMRKFNECRYCPYSDCPDRQDIPEIEIYNLTN